jgi:hypothetical protein
MERQMDTFDKPDITIFTVDDDASMALWRMANSAKDDGDNSFDMREKMQKALTPERVHEIWIVVNDALQSGALLATIYAALKAVKGLNQKKLSIHFRAGLKVSRDDQDQFEAIGCEVHFEKDETEISLPAPDADHGD